MHALNKTKWVLALLAFSTVGISGARATPFVTVTTLGTNPVDSLSQSANGFTTYLIRVITDNGALITAVDAGGIDPGTGLPSSANGLFGPMLQRWNFDNDPPSSPVATGRFSPASSSTIDSHFLVPAASRADGIAPDEDNTLVNPPGSPPDSGSIDFGTGSYLTGSFGIQGAKQASTLDLAYIVLPTNQLGTYSLSVATSEGTKTLLTGVIPEPSSAVLLVSSLGMLLGRRRK